MIGSKGDLAGAASALAITLHARDLTPAKETGIVTTNAVRNLKGLLEALMHRAPKEEGEGDLERALLLVDHINRLAWRYFVQRLPHDGYRVMEEVGRCPFGSNSSYLF